MTGNGGTVSVVIVLWNCSDFLCPCLDAVRAQSLSGLEIIAVDNASADGSAELFAREMPDRLLIRNDTNLGFAGAANQGIDASNGEFVFLLNPDVVLADNCLQRLVEAMTGEGECGGINGECPGTEDDSVSGIGWAAAKLLQLDQGVKTNRIDSTGHFLTRARYPLNRGWGEEDRGQFDDDRQLFGGCAAATLYRRSMLEAVRLDSGCFDGHFHSYFEDADLDWRAALAGWRCLFVPAAVAWHERGGTGGQRLVRVRRDMIRNHLLMMVKNDHPFLVLRDFAFILLFWAKTLGLMIRNPRLFAGLWDAVRLLPRALSKRRRIQALRRVSLSTMMSWYRDLPLGEKLQVVITRAVGPGAR